MKEKDLLILKNKDGQDFIPIDGVDWRKFNGIIKI